MSGRELALQVSRRLREQGFQALFVGGCVRDLVLGREPADFDVATDATPDQVLALFPNSLAVGAQFGVVVVVDGEHRVEVATFRSDVGYSDGRHPDRVAYARSAQEDVQRRDFTINGLLMNPESGEILDYVGGRADLKTGLIRAIGEPSRRFAEDKLRMMRAVRFAARFGYAIEAGTLIRTGPSGAVCATPPDEVGGVLFSQLQDLSDCAGISVQLNGRFDIFQRRVRVF